MDLRERIRIRHRHRKPRDTAKLAAQLAPPEERAPDKFHGAHQEVGAIVVHNENGGISRDLIEGGKESHFLGMEPIVAVIVVVLLAWIIFIAWKISEMPIPA